MGVTWHAVRQKCLLRQYMVPTAAGGTGLGAIDSAVRITGPAGSDAWTQKITNGGFDFGDFNSWSANGATLLDKAA